MTPPPPSGDRYAILRQREFRLYLIGRFIATCGDNMLVTAVGWELYERTRSSFNLGLVGLVQIVPLMFLALPAGHLADQSDRRRIILWSGAFTALSCAGLTVASFTHAPVGWIFACLLIGAIARAYRWPASGAFLPQIVPRALFPDAVTWSSGSYQISAALGPALGGLAIALTGGAAIVYGFNVVAAVISIALIALIRPLAPLVARPGKMSVASLSAGVSFVFRQPIILGTITLDLFAVLLGGASALLPVYARDILHVGPAGLGWLQAALPIGSASMAAWVAHRPPMEHAGRSMLFAVAGFGVATIIFGWSRSFWLSLAMMAACGALDAVSVVVRHTLVQVLTPDEMRGRVSAVNSLFIGASNEFGSFESGLVASWLGPVFAVVSGGFGTILVVIATALLWPQIRRVGRLDAEKVA